MERETGNQIAVWNGAYKLEHDLKPPQRMGVLVGAHNQDMKRCVEVDLWTFFMC
jgi:hypothetical protein